MRISSLLVVTVAALAAGLLSASQPTTAHIAVATNHLRPYSFTPNCGANRIAPIGLVFYNQGLPVNVKAHFEHINDFDPFLELSGALVRHTPPPAGVPQTQPTVVNPIYDHFGTHFDPQQDPNGINCRVKSQVMVNHLVGWSAFSVNRLGNTAAPPYTTADDDTDSNTVGNGNYTLGAPRYAWISTTCVGSECHLPLCYWVPPDSQGGDGYKVAREYFKDKFLWSNHGGSINHTQPGGDGAAAQFWDNRLVIDLGSSCENTDPITPDGYVRYLRI